jgi:hypothetical protein
MAANGVVSYLVRDNRTAAAKRAADGVYFWEVRFMMDSGQVQNMTAMTGLLDVECGSKP